MKVLVLHIVVMSPKLLNQAYTVPLVTQLYTIPNSLSLPSPVPRCMCRNISTLNHNNSVPLGPPQPYPQALPICSLILKPSPFFVLRFVFTEKQILY